MSSDTLYINFYICTGCKVGWTFRWNVNINDACPSCRLIRVPYKSNALAPNNNIIKYVITPYNTQIRSNLLPLYGMSKDSITKFK